MGLLFLAGVYFLARGVFALCGRPVFYTKRVLEHIAPEELRAYLKEVGGWNMVTGAVFLAKAALDRTFPNSRPLLGVFLLALAVCAFFLSKVNEKYTR